MSQAINSVFRKATTLSGGNGARPAAPPARPSFLRGRRKDDIAVAAIVVLLGVLFFVQLGWVILNRTHA